MTVLALSAALVIGIGSAVTPSTAVAYEYGSTYGSYDSLTIIGLTADRRLIRFRMIGPPRPAALATSADSVATPD